MREIEAIHGERFPRLFSRIGHPTSALGTRCRDVNDARERLFCQYFDYAVNEARNELYEWGDEHGYCQDEEEQQQWQLDGETCGATIRAMAFRLQDAGFDEAAQQRLVQKTTVFMLFAVLERRWKIPADDRIFSPIDAIIAKGHIVRGWVDGLYPEGEWAVW